MTSPAARGRVGLAALAALAALALPPTSIASEKAVAAADPDLARRLGADQRGMRGYVFVILKTGPNKVPAGPERDEMFKGHFANIKRLSEQGLLSVAGPLDGVDGRRGIFVLNVTDLDEARRLLASDPVVAKGEMVPELHKFYSSAALMIVPETHEKIAPK